VKASGTAFRVKVLGVQVCLAAERLDHLIDQAPRFLLVILG
jgi:hypothetical protein